ncbi:MAG: AAA family ATPase [Acidimicrobiales bacterium]
MSESVRPGRTSPAHQPRAVVRELFALAPPESSPGEHPLAPPAEPRQRSGRGPQLSWLSIEGYGVLANVEIGGLSEGITVLLGPNEAGKSTIFDFLTAILFGFPSRKSDDHYRAPVRGGRHGGRVGLTDASGATWVVERYASPKKQLTITAPDGTSGNELDLKKILGGANSELFRAVFAVDLDDLKRLEGMSSEEVREVLFSSSVLGQRRSAARAMKELDNRRDSLVKPRHGGIANVLSDRLRETRRELDDARRCSSRFGALLAEAQEKQRQLVALRAAEHETRTKISDLQLLARCWDVVSSLREHEAALTALRPVTDFEQELLDATDQVARVRSQLSGHVERLNGYRQLSQQQKLLAESVERRIDELGGPWARELATSDDFDPDLLRAELGEQLAELRRIDMDIGVARATIAKEHRQLETGRGPGAESSSGAVATESSLPDATTLRKRSESLRELSAWLVHVDQMSRDVERDIELEHRRVELAPREQFSTVPRAFVAASVLAALVLFGVSAVLVIRHQALLAAALALVALSWALVTIWTGRSARRTASFASRPNSGATAKESASDTLQSLFADKLARLAAARQRMEAAARKLQIELPLSQVEVQRALTEAEHLVDERRRVDTNVELTRQVRNRIAEAESDLGRLEQELSVAEAAVAGFARARRLPLTASPAELGDIIERLANLRKRLDALSRVEADLALGEQAIGSFEAAVAQLGARFNIQAPPVTGAGPVSEEELSQLLERLSATVASLETRAQQRTAAANGISAANREIERMLGQGERAGVLRGELDSGRVLDWQAASAAAVGELETLQADHEQMLREHEGLSRELGELTASTEIPRLEQRCLELEETLRTTMAEYLVVSGGRLLLQRTLKRYEQQRQPLVLERAASHFARVTAGRYVRLGVDTALDGSKPSVRAFRPDGAVVDAGELSRGTMEQLYLCLRLGLAESFADQYVPLPVVLDDVLVNFDHDRQEAVIRELAETSQQHQVILLTCHPEAAALVDRVLAERSPDGQRPSGSRTTPVRKIELRRL